MLSGMWDADTASGKSTIVMLRRRGRDLELFFVSVVLTGDTQTGTVDGAHRGVPTFLVLSMTYDGVL